MITNQENQEIFRNRNTMSKYFEIFFARCSMALKENKEYKSSLYGYIFSDTIIFITYFIFFSVLKGVIFEILNFNLLDYIIYLCLLFISAKIMWSFSLINFKDILLTGNLNMYLVKPVNSYFISSMTHLRGATLPLIIVFIVSTIYLTFNFSYTNKVISLLIFIYGSIYFIVWVNFINSLAFFMKNASFIHEIINRKILFMVEQFTPKMFEESIFKVFVYLLPSSLACFIVIDVLRGNLAEYLIYLFYSFIIFVVFILGTYLLWYYGLKKYEAFG